MTPENALDRALHVLVEPISLGDRAEIRFSDFVNALQARLAIERDEAAVLCEQVEEQCRHGVLVDGYFVQWQMFRNAFVLIRLPSPDEIQNTAELLTRGSLLDLEAKICTLTGRQFERFLKVLLSRQEEYRAIRVTKTSHDEGIDFEGYYIPNQEIQLRLIGQAKNWRKPVSAAVARDFLGALATSKEQGPVYGLIVNTGGFTKPARKTLQKAHNFVIKCWDLNDLVTMGRGIATRKLDLSFEVPDPVFWEEVLA
jgi:hypothetical protein